MGTKTLEIGVQIELNCKVRNLTLDTGWADSGVDNLMKFFFLFFPENKIWHFMQIVS